MEIICKNMSLNVKKEQKSKIDFVASYSIIVDTRKVI